MLSRPIRFLSALLCVVQLALPVLPAQAGGAFFRNSNSSARWFQVDNRSLSPAQVARKSQIQERKRWEAARKRKGALAAVLVTEETQPAVVAVAETQPVVAPAPNLVPAPAELAPRKSRNRLVAIGAAFLVSTLALTDYLSDHRATPPTVEIPKTEFRVKLEPKTVEPIAVEPATVEPLVEAPVVVAPAAVVTEPEAVTPLPPFTGPVLTDSREIDGVVAKPVGHDSETPTALIVTPTADPGVKQVQKVVKHHYGE